MLYRHEKSIKLTRRIYLRRKSHLLVPARRQRGGVIRAGSFRSQDVHVDLERYELVVHRDLILGTKPCGTVLQFGSDGIQRRVRHKLHHILLQRSLRAQAPRSARVRHQPILFRRVPVRDHAVRRDGRLEIVRTVYRDLTARERRDPIQSNNLYLIIT